MNEVDNIFAMSSCGRVLQFYYWYSTNNYDKPESLVKDLQERGYILQLDYYETVLTSFQIIGLKRLKKQENPCSS